MRQGIVAKSELKAQARGHVPVIHPVKGWRLVDVIPDRRRLGLGVIGSEPQQDIHEAVVGSAARRISALLITEELLVLGVPVVAEPILQGVPAERLRNIHSGRDVVAGVVPRR